MQHQSSLNIIVVEDDDPLRELMVSVLRAEGHQVTGLEDAEALDDEGGSTPIDLLVTDLNLPGESGLSLARRFREAQPGSGVIMVTALDQTADKVSGYEHGADVYLTKPIEPIELVAAVRSFSRRHQEMHAPQEDDSALMVDQNRLTLSGKSGSISITRDEVLILSGLARAAGHMLESWQLFELLGIDSDSYTKSALEVRIVRLRKKLVEAGYDRESIKSIRGKGYQLCQPVRIV